MKVLLIIFALNLIAFAQCRDLSRTAGETVPEQLAEQSERIEVCIDEHLGCFPETEPNSPTSVGDSIGDWFENQFWRSSRDNVGTEFRFWAPGKKEYTRITNGNFHEYITETSGYDASLKAIFIIHGFHGGEAPWAVTIKDALMKKEPSNIFIVDWSKGDGLMYGTASANSWIVGAELGRFIERIGIKTGMTLDKVHLIGHSLGAHAAGFAGKWLQNKLKKKVRRITGLDPAGPDFEDVVVGERLDRSDAEFVDTIHTNYAYSFVDGYGIVKPIGHFDFYPNGGANQPGCATVGEAEAEIAEEAFEFINPVYKLFTLAQGDEQDIGDAFDHLVCNHGRAIQFFIESITSTTCSFYAEECGSWQDYLDRNCDRGHRTVPMGYDAEKYKYFMDPNDSKKFYLSTNSKEPFCQYRSVVFL